MHVLYINIYRDKHVFKHVCIKLPFIPIHDPLGRLLYPVCILLSSCPGRLVVLCVVLFHTEDLALFVLFLPPTISATCPSCRFPGCGAPWGAVITVCLNFSPGPVPGFTTSLS